MVWEFRRGCPELPGRKNPFYYFFPIKTTKRNPLTIDLVLTFVPSSVFYDI